MQIEQCWGIFKTKLSKRMADLPDEVLQNLDMVEQVEQALIDFTEEINGKRYARSVKKQLLKSLQGTLN